MQPQASVRVLIADNQPLLREGLLGVLTQYADLHPVGTAASEAEAAVLCQRLRPDVVVINGSLSVPTIVRRLQKTGIPCKVVALIEPMEEQVTLTVIKAGVDGIVSLTEPPEKIVAAIRTVAQGSKYLPEIGMEK